MNPISTLTRRTLLASAIATIASNAMAASSEPPDFATRIAAIQARTGGRVGVCLLDTGSGRALQFHADERFAMCSTFKLLLAAQVLSQVDARKLDLERRVAYANADLLPTSPVTKQHIAAGSLSVRELCAAVVEVSDNAAANLLLNLVGGPPSLTAFLQSSGDRVTRLDRKEVELNTNLPGDPRDTTTPAAMAGTVAKLLTGDVLAPSSRDRLIGWMKNSSTGVRRLRAGLPADWTAGDKTGTGTRGAVNDVMIAFPPKRQPLVAAVYMSDSTLPTLSLEEAHKDIGACIGLA
jgi:beta-lactamase class A